MPAGEAPTFAERLLAWYDQHGRKDLPWQHPRTPYRVWISEVMLQQTQVATVIPYFERWVSAFPDVQKLAAAPLDEILSHWAGLGYYARARNIHKAAVICATDLGGELPTQADELLALPGIGLSTANAIISQSTDRPAPVLDGNVRRVLARHTATEGWTGGSRVQKILWKEAESRLPKQRGADYTQAIMYLGALVCTRSKPDCTNCPVAQDCTALQQDLVSELPSPRPPARVKDQSFILLMMLDESGRVLLEKRPGAGVWGGLWCLPMGDSLESVAETVGMNLETTTTLPALEHRLSHIRMSLKPVLAVPGSAAQVKCSPRLSWFDREQQKRLGLPKPISDLLGRLANGDLK